MTWPGIVITCEQRPGQAEKPRGLMQEHSPDLHRVVSCLMRPKAWKVAWSVMVRDTS